MNRLSFAFFSLLAMSMTTLQAAAGEAIEAADPVSTVPESSVALFLGGFFWFLLLRKRT